ncbi:MAG: hypothetical protein GOU97_00920 [Nanoarchaeota archaeon]|nr:hypothetical protein [Nanoarchaeota archaeon]
MNISEQAQPVIITLVVLGILFVLMLVMFQAGLLVQLTKTTCSTSAQMKQVFVSQLGGGVGAAALAGAAAGSVVPGVGTAIGATAGALIGAGISTLVISRIVIAFPLLCPPQELGTISYKKFDQTFAKLAVDCWEQYGSGKYDPLVGKQPLSKCYAFLYDFEKNKEVGGLYDEYDQEYFPDRGQTYKELLNPNKVLLCFDYDSPGTLCTNMEMDNKLLDETLKNGKVYVSYYDSAASAKPFITSDYCNNAVIKNADRAPLDCVVICIKEVVE